MKNALCSIFYLHLTYVIKKNVQVRGVCVGRNVTNRSLSNKRQPPYQIVMLVSCCRFHVGTVSGGGLRSHGASLGGGVVNEGPTSSVRRAVSRALQLAAELIRGVDAQLRLQDHPRALGGLLEDSDVQGGSRQWENEQDVDARHQSFHLGWAHSDTLTCRRSS